MKKVNDPFAEMVGEDMSRLVFNAKEVATLLRAAAILEQARTYFEEDSDEETDLAIAEYGCRDAAERYGEAPE